MTHAPPVPRIVVTDATGRRQIPVKALLTLGRRSESAVRVSGVGMSRLDTKT